MAAENSAFYHKNKLHEIII